MRFNLPHDFILDDCLYFCCCAADEYSHVERLAHSLTPYETCFAFFLALLEYDREPPIASWARSVVTPRFQGEPCGEREMTWCLQGCALSFISLPKVVARISSSPIVVLEIDIACTDDQHTNANVNSFTGRLVSLETIISGGGVGKRTASTVLESRGDISIEFVTNIFPPTSDGMWPPRTSPLFNNPLNVDLLVVINSTPDTPGIKFAFDLAFINN